MEYHILGLHPPHTGLTCDMFPGHGWTHAPLACWLHLEGLLYLLGMGAVNRAWPNTMPDWHVSMGHGSTSVPDWHMSMGHGSTGPCPIDTCHLEHKSIGHATPVLNFSLLNLVTENRVYWWQKSWNNILFSLRTQILTGPPNLVRDRPLVSSPVAAEVIWSSMWPAVVSNSHKTFLKLAVELAVMFRSPCVRDACHAFRSPRNTFSFSIYICVISKQKECTQCTQRRTRHWANQSLYLCFMNVENTVLKSQICIPQATYIFLKMQKWLTLVQYPTHTLHFTKKHPSSFLSFWDIGLLLQLSPKCPGSVNLNSLPSQTWKVKLDMFYALCSIQTKKKQNKKNSFWLPSELLWVCGMLFQLIKQ